MKNEKIISLFKEKLSEKVTSIKDCSRGIEQIVYIVKTENSNYIIKFPRKGNELMPFRENFAYKKLYPKQPVPKPILFGRNYLILSYLDGRMLSESRLSRKEKEVFYFNLGKILKNIHKIKMKGFGELQANGKGEFTKFKDHVNFLLKRDIPRLVKTNLISNKQLNCILEYITKSNGLAKQAESVLLHFDLTDNNILVENKRIAGIIDFGDASCGPREYDLAVIFNINYGTTYFSNVLTGYGKRNIDINKVHYFALFRLLDEIPYFHSIEDKKKCRKLIQLLNKIIGYKK